MKKTFLYVEQHYIPLNGKDSLTKLGLEIFRREAFHRLAATLSQALVMWIDVLRTGQDVDNLDIKQGIGTFMQIDIDDPALTKHAIRDGSLRLKWEGDLLEPYYYREYFETALIRSTRQRYAAEAAELAQYIGTEYYFQRIKEIFSIEDKLARDLFLEMSRDTIKHALIQEFIEGIRQVQTMGGKSGIQDMFNAHSRDVLGDLVTLFGDDPHMIALFQKQFEVFIDLSVNTTFTQLGDLGSYQFIRQLTDFDYEATQIIDSVFKQEQHFYQVKRTAFQKALNELDELPFVTAKYSDLLLTKEIGAMDEAQIIFQIREFGEFIDALRDKELFIAHYSNFLAKRLLKGTSLNSDAEKLIVKEFKTRCGTNAAHKLTVMLNDIEKSEDINSKYSSQFAHNGIIDGVKLNFSVLQSGA